MSIVFGFAVWSACILFRLLRLYHFFLLNRPHFSVPFLFGGGSVLGLPALSFKEDWLKILAVLCAPMVVLYGFLLPVLGDNVHKRVGGK